MQSLVIQGKRFTMNGLTGESNINAVLKDLSSTEKTRIYKQCNQIRNNNQRHNPVLNKLLKNILLLTA